MHQNAPYPSLNHRRIQQTNRFGNFMYTYKALFELVSWNLKPKKQHPNQKKGSYPHEKPMRSKKRIQANCCKRGKARVIKSRLFEVLHLIGWEGVRTFLTNHSATAFEALFIISQTVTTERVVCPAAKQSKILSSVYRCFNSNRHTTFFCLFLQLFEESCKLPVKERFY